MELHNLFNIEFRAYIAGIMVPTISVSITSAFNAAPSATLTMPPYPQLYGIGRKDRLPVQVFIKETFVESETYILIFDGEISDFSYVSNSIGREIVLNAQSVFAVLRDVNITFLTSLEDITRYGIVPGENNRAVQSTQSGLTFPTSLFMRGIGSHQAVDLIQTPTDFLENVYNFVAKSGDEANSKNLNNSKLANFYKKYAKYINLLNRYVKVPYFDDVGEVWETGGDKAGAFPLIDGMQKATALKQLTRMANRGPAEGSLYELLNFIVQQMEYEYAFFNSPSYKSSGQMVSTCLKPLLYEAYPPACNLIFRPLVESIRTSEKVYRVPTRVRTRDLGGIMDLITQGDDSTLAAYGKIDYYPTEEYENSPPPKDATGNWFASELLKEEEFTGSYLHETNAPPWLSYVDKYEIESGDLQDYKHKILKHMLMLKRYEVRQLQLSLAYNPYIVAGFPAVVFDAEESGFTFVGHVISVNHNLSKGEAATQITLGFVRLIDEDPLENPLEKVNEITHDKAKMSEIYQKLLGCDAVTYDEARQMQNDNEQSFQANPLEAYGVVRRQDITTFEQYLSFMGLSTDEEALVLNGDYAEDRFNIEPPSNIFPKFHSKPTPSGKSEEAVPESHQVDENDGLKGIRWILRQIAEREFENEIYY